MTVNAKKSMFKNVVALSIGLFLAIAALEIAGRVLAAQIGFKAWATSLRDSPPMSSYIRYHPLIGYEIDPDIDYFVYDRNRCIKTDPVTVTPEGNRVTGRENSANSTGDGPRIAVLGDSMTMAREVGDYEHFSAGLQKLLPTSMVTNFGVPGYSTVQEYSSYSVKAANTDPDIVVLAFLEVNDVIESHRRLAGTGSLSRLRPFMSADGDEILPPAMTPEEAEQDNSAGRRWNRILLRNSFTYFAVNQLLNASKSRAAKESPGDQPTKPEGEEYWWEYRQGANFLAMYQNPPDAVFEAAWRDVEQAILKLNAEILRHDRHLVVLFLPMTEFRGFVPGLKAYEKKFGASEPPGFDLGYPANRMKEFGAANGIDVLDLTPQFDKYLQIHELKQPIFNFHCDGHYNPVGHYLTANGLAEYLLQKELVDEQAVLRNPDYLDKSPEELLGPEAYKAIFEEGNVYTGNSRLNQAP